MLKKIIYDVSDESMVTHWMGNPYLQDFTGEKAFQDLTWNLLNLISGVSKTENGTTTQLASYNWYADGTKYSAERSDGSGYVYKGNVIYERAANGTLTLDCVLTTGGRIVANKNSSGTITGYTVYHHITDHLGSVRAITDASTGTVVETSDYLPFGTRWSRTGGSLITTLTDSTNRWRYSGKEEQKAIDAALPLIDYGARMYDPTIARWMSVDPLAEKYYPVGPYIYCAGNPVRSIDINGESITDYYNLRGKLKKSVNDGKTDKYFVLKTVSNETMLLKVPSNSVLNKMDQAYKKTEKTGLEHGFRVGEQGGSSIIISGSPDEITYEQWKPAIDDLRENVGENVSYDAHTHPKKESGSTNIPSEEDLAEAVGNQPNYVLGYEAFTQLEQVPGQVFGEQQTSIAYKKSVSVYDKTGKRSKPFDYEQFKKTSQKLNKE